jgi:hypothetical protein
VAPGPSEGRQRLECDHYAFDQRAICRGYVAAGLGAAPDDCIVEPPVAPGDVSPGEPRPLRLMKKNTTSTAMATAIAAIPTL